jgi:maltose phosphorylase
MLAHSQFMVNTVDWVYTRLTCNSEPLDLAKIRFDSFERVLDMRTGVLTRSFFWHVDDGTVLHVEFERFLSMGDTHLTGQRITLRTVKGSARLSATVGLDFSPLHLSTGHNYWNCSGAAADGGTCRIVGTTEHTGHKLFAACSFRGLGSAVGLASNDNKFVGARTEKALAEGEEWCITRVAMLVAAIGGGATASFEAAVAQNEAHLPHCDYDMIKAESAAWWSQQWALSDVEIDGDEDNQQGIRYSIFQLHQTMHGAGHSALIGAKGLTGEFYNGNTFWETEVYCLPFYLFTNPAAAKSLLQFRYDTLPQALARAGQLDCDGAYYPIATISGEECCDLWQHANLQLQPSTAVAYGLWLYHSLMHDDEFMFSQGAEMLVGICRMLATRGGWDSKTGEYGFFAVMGPDEFAMMVNHNTYTNFMGQKTFRFALSVLEKMKNTASNLYDVLVQKVALGEEELVDWKHKADKMCILYEAKTELFEQHDGFFRLPHIDIASIPAEEFPLYSHWSYDRIYRGDMLKQPDVLMFMLMYNSDFTLSQLRANYDYYEPRCIHESSLSPSVHSILASQLGLKDQAYSLFRFAARLDLDNYNRNTREGLHISSIAANWMSVVYGFGGLRSDGETVSLAPVIPEAWNSYSFTLLLKGVPLRVKVTKDKVSLAVITQGDATVNLLLYGIPVTVTNQELNVLQPIQEGNL